MLLISAKIELILTKFYNSKRYSDVFSLYLFKYKNIFVLEYVEIAG